MFCRSDLDYITKIIYLTLAANNQKLNCKCALHRIKMVQTQYYCPHCCLFARLSLQNFNLIKSPEITIAPYATDNKEFFFCR